MLNLNYVSIEYNAQEKLMNLAEKIADSRKTSKISKYLDQAAKIRYFLKAVSYKTTYLTDTQVNNIYQCLIDVAEIQDYPVTPALPTFAVPSNGTTIIVAGAKGDKGDTGGATDFSVIAAGFSQVVDSFAVGSAYAARWDYIINSTAQRAGTVIATWTEDGAAVDWQDTSSQDVNGSTAGIELSVIYAAGFIQLIANITSGSWNVSGSRYFIPNGGAGVNVATTPLPNGQVYIGNASNVPTPQTLSGDITTTNTGVTSITSGVIVNTDISGTAAIDVTKLATLPNASAAVVTDAGSHLTTLSTVSATKVGYLTDVTSNIQAQLDSKLSGATGAISTVTSVNLTASKAVISDPSGKIAASSTTSAEIGFVGGVTSAIQTQLNGKVSGSSLTNLWIPKASGSSSIVNSTVLDDGTDIWTTGGIHPGTKIFQPSAFSGAITLINGWTGTIKYRTSVDGMVTLTGILNGTSASANVFCNAAQLPTCINSGAGFMCRDAGSGTPRGVVISAAGGGSVDTYAVSSLIDLSGVIYWNY